MFRAKFGTPTTKFPLTLPTRFTVGELTKSASSTRVSSQSGLAAITGIHGASCNRYAGTGEGSENTEHVTRIIRLSPRDWQTYALAVRSAMAAGGHTRSEHIQVSSLVKKQRVRVLRCATRGSGSCTPGARTDGPTPPKRTTTATTTTANRSDVMFDILDGLGVEKWHKTRQKDGKTTSRNLYGIGPIKRKTTRKGPHHGHHEPYLVCSSQNDRCDKYRTAWIHIIDGLMGFYEGTMEGTQHQLTAFKSERLPEADVCAAGNSRSDGWGKIDVSGVGYRRRFARKSRRRATLTSYP